MTVKINRLSKKTGVLEIIAEEGECRECGEQDSELLPFGEGESLICSSCGESEEELTRERMNAFVLKRITEVMDEEEGRAGATLH